MRELKTKGVVLHSNQKIADKKKADYQGLEKSCADSVARSRDSYMKDPEKSCARSRESYKNDLEKSRDDSAARSCEHRRRNLGPKGPVPAQYYAMY